MEAAARGQSNPVPAMEGDKCPSLEQEKSSSFSPKETVFICQIALQLGFVKKQILSSWWWLGEPCFTSFSPLWAGRDFARLWRQVPAWSWARKGLALPLLRELLNLNTLRQGPDWISRPPRLEEWFVLLAKGKVKGRFECTDARRAWGRFNPSVIAFL